MKHFCEKAYLELIPPTEDAPHSDHMQLEHALSAAGYAGAHLSLNALQQLHEACLRGNYHITASLVYREYGWIASTIEAGDTRSKNYGLAVDYGSTTIVMQLVDLNSGQTIAQLSETNGQRAYGDDILTRITYALEKPEHADELQRVTAETFNTLLIRLQEESGIPVRSCPVMIVSGNTTMIHFLLKLNAWTVFASPYAPVTLDPGWFSGRELGMNFAGTVYIIPAASNYVGGDIVSGLLNLDFYRRDEIGVFFDIGTNGELVMGNREWLIAGAGAAGPALEGYISRYGIRAQNGAIDSICIRGSALSYTTIGNDKPIGICGSGIIDLLAEMRLNGWINVAGELNPAASERIVYLEDEQQYAAVYATAEQSASGAPLFFTQTDIQQYLETKAAAHTMVDCMLDSAGCTEDDIDHMYLTGAFAAHSNLESAITIGMFPDLPRERISGLPNASLQGARALLLDRSHMNDIHYLRENMYCIQFASVPDFIVRMHAAKFIPHTDMSRYPSVQEKLNRNIHR